jgi:MFS family permease
MPAAEPHEGYRTGTPQYRRVSIALFAAGVATFALLYSTQALLPELSTAFDVSPTQSTLSLSFATVGLGVALLVAGPLSEVLGRTRLIHLSLWLSGIGQWAGWRWALVAIAVDGPPPVSSQALRLPMRMALPNGSRIAKSVP